MLYASLFENLFLHIFSGTLVLDHDQKKKVAVASPFLIPHGGPFASSSTFIQALYSLSCISISLWCFVLDYLLSKFISTTATSDDSDVLIVFLFKVRSIF